MKEKSEEIGRKFSIGKMRLPRDVTEFNKLMRHCIMDTMMKNRDISVTAPKAMEACSFAYRNRNVPIEPTGYDKRIRMFLTGEIDPKDPRWIPTKKEKEETKRRLIEQMGKKKYEEWISSL